MGADDYRSNMCGFIEFLPNVMAAGGIDPRRDLFLATFSAHADGRRRAAMSSARVQTCPPFDRLYAGFPTVTY